MYVVAPCLTRNVKDNSEDCTIPHIIFGLKFLMKQLRQFHKNNDVRLKNNFRIVALVTTPRKDSFISILLYKKTLQMVERGGKEIYESNRFSEEDRS